MQQEIGWKESLSPSDTCPVGLQNHIRSHQRVLRTEQLNQDQGFNTHCYGLVNREAKRSKLQNDYSIAHHNIVQSTSQRLYCGHKQYGDDSNMESFNNLLVVGDTECDDSICNDDRLYCRFELDHLTGR